MRLRVWSYSMKSTVARAIAGRLGGLMIKHSGSTYRHNPGDIVINWGASQVPSRYPVSLNQPEAVAVCCSKIRSYKALAAQRVPTCEWTTDAAVARSWFTAGHSVYARTRDSGARGQGISVIQAGGNWDEQLANASATGDIRFFTKHISNDREFRVYVVGDSITSVLEKRRREGTQASEYVRSHGNNWVFARSHRGPVPDSLLNASKAALKALGLDFGGVDIVLDRQGNPVVLEVNSAPGVDAPTAQTEFVQGLARLIKERFNVDLPCS
jgi:glutathione synthase/RimK-type ligase-like ATP-grasp enzyme